MRSSKTTQKENKSEELRDDEIVGVSKLLSEDNDLDSGNARALSNHCKKLS